MSDGRDDTLDKRRRDLFEQLRSQAGKIPDFSVLGTPISHELSVAIRDAHQNLVRASIPTVIDPDATPAGRAAVSSERTADTIETMASLTKDIVDLAEHSLRLSESARADAARSEIFAKRMAWVSVIIAGASLATAVVAIVVSAA